jgi:lipoprotein-releasing system permease protein
MLTHYESVQGAVIRGVVPAAEIGVSVVSNKLVDGELALSDGRYNVVLGRGLANALRARVGSRVTLIAPEPMRTPAGMVPRLRRFNVVGIFEAGVHEYDTSLALVHLEDAKRMFRYGDGISGVRLKLADPFDAPQVGARLLQTLQTSGSEVLRITDWTQTNVNLFRALKTEKMVMFIILALTIAVAAFNLVSTLVMVVAEKGSEIAILQTLGMTRTRIIRVFFIHGGLIGIVGIIVGVVLGVALSNNVHAIVSAAEELLNFKILSPDVYYISEIPSQLELRDVVVAIVVSVGLCLIAPLYPALIASRTSPVGALRYD